MLDKGLFACLIQCRSGHAFTGEYFRAIEKLERGLHCLCGEALQTHDHLLVHCLEYGQYRYILRDASPELSIPDLLGTQDGIFATAKFLRKSGAFARPTTLEDP